MDLKIYSRHTWYCQYCQCYFLSLLDDETQLSHDPLFATSHGTSVLTAVANNYTSSPAAEISEEDGTRICEFLILLATCNTVVVSAHSHNATVSSS